MVLEIVNPFFPVIVIAKSPSDGLVNTKSGEQPEAFTYLCGL
jgi:hypothetical protein